MNDLIRLAFAYAPARCREALLAVWALDATMGRIVASTTELMIGQMRLTWWHDSLMALDAGQIPPEPVLATLVPVVRDYDVSPAALASLVEGWEALIASMPLGDENLRSFASLRGERLFDLAARVTDTPVSFGLGAGWALIDFAGHCSDEVTAERAWSMAAEFFDGTDVRGPKPLRILARLAKAKVSRDVRDIAKPPSRWDVAYAVLR